MYPEPIREYDKFLLHEHMRFDPEFQGLINYKDQSNDKYDVTIFQLILKFYQK